MFGFTYPAQCVVGMVCGVHSRGWYALNLLVLGGKGWHISTIHILSDTLSGCVTQDPRVDPMGACAIHPTEYIKLRNIAKKQCMNRCVIKRLTEACLFQSTLWTYSVAHKLLMYFKVARSSLGRG